MRAKVARNGDIQVRSLTENGKLWVDFPDTP